MLTRRRLGNRLYLDKASAMSSRSSLVRVSKSDFSHLQLRVIIKKRATTHSVLIHEIHKEPAMARKQKESLLRSKHVAYILDCSPDDVIELARKGKLKGTKMGRFWRFRQEDVLEYRKSINN